MTERIIQWGMQKIRSASMLDRIFHKTGHQIRREAGKLIEKKKDRFRFSTKNQFTSRKNN